MALRWGFKTEANHIAREVRAELGLRGSSTRWIPGRLPVTSRFRSCPLAPMPGWLQTPSTTSIV